MPDGVSTSKLRYSASNGGGDAIRKFSTGYALAMVTGLGEVIEQIKNGSLRALGITSEQRIEGLDAPTLKEQGIDVVLANWRVFFCFKRYSSRLAGKLQGYACNHEQLSQVEGYPQKIWLGAVLSDKQPSINFPHHPRKNDQESHPKN